jgi:hypothetical protein
MNRREFEEAEQAIIDAKDFAKAAIYSIRKGHGTGGGHSLSAAVTRDHLGTMRINAISAIRTLEDLVHAIERLDPSLED